VVARHFMGAGTRVEARLADGTPIAAVLGETDPDRLPAEGAMIRIGADRMSFLDLTR
jgi:hypothetical protein